MPPATPPGEATIDYLRLPLYRYGLERALQFDDADLEANRSGTLGPGQRLAQVRQLYVTFAGTLVVATLACVLGVLTLSLGSLTGTALNGVLATAACMFGTGYFGWYGLRLWLDERAGEVRSAAGFIRPTEREIDIRRTPVWIYYWTIDGGPRFAVTGKAYGALTPGPHRLFYLLRTRRVIAAEPVLT